MTDFPFAGFIAMVTAMATYVGDVCDVKERADIIALDMDRDFEY